MIYILKSSLWLGAIALLTAFAGCDDVIYDDLSECPMGVYLSFYEITAAGDTLTVYPGKEPQRPVTVLVFDKSGTLVGMQSETMPVSTDAADRHKLFIPVNKAGEYSFVAWSGTPGGFDLNGLTVGSARREDIVAVLQRSQDTVDGSKQVHLYYGAFKTHDPATGNKYTQSDRFGSNTVIFKDPAEYGSQFADILVGMVEQTRRMHIKGIGFGFLDSQVDDLKIVIKGKTGDYGRDATFSANVRELTYTSVKTPSGGNDLLIDFNTLGKILEEDRNTTLEISFTDKAGNKVVKSYKLIDLIKADPKYSDIDYNLVFDYNLEIEITFYMAASGEVMNWTLVSRNIELK